MKSLSFLLALLLCSPSPAAAGRFRAAAVPAKSVAMPTAVLSVGAPALGKSAFLAAPALPVPGALHSVLPAPIPVAVEARQAPRAQAAKRVAAIMKQAAGHLQQANASEGSAENGKSAGDALDLILRGETAGEIPVGDISAGIASGGILLLSPAGALNAAAEERAVPAPRVGPILTAAGSGMLFIAAAVASAALLPGDSAAWPVLGAFSAVATLVTGALSYEAISDGALSAALGHRRDRAGLAAALERELPEAFDRDKEGRDRYREHDADAVREFAEAWRLGDGAARRALLSALNPRDDIWREKILTAALIEAARPAGGGDITGEIGEASRRFAARSMMPMAPILETLLSRRGSFASLEHPVAGAVLREWADAELGEDASRGQARVRPRAPRWATALSAGVLAALVSLGGFSAYKSADYYEAQSRSSAVSLRVFYADDLYIFGDSYFDERIPKKVLPAMRAWHSTGAAAEARLAAAVEILRDSPDPKADNLLEAAFKRADLLPLTADSEKTLMRTLVERENETLWRSLLEFSAKFPESESVARRLIAAIDIAAEIDSTPVFKNLFYFLNSPAARVRGRAIEAITASLENPNAAAPFFTRLDEASREFSDDARLQMWTAYFTLERLSKPGAESLELAKAKTILDRSVDAARAADAKRVAAIAHLEPGEESKLPPLMLSHLLDLMRAKLQAGAEAPLQEAVRQQLFRVAKGLVEQSKESFKILEAQFKSTGVMKPDGARTVYKLNHLRELGGLVDRAGAAAMGMHGPARLSDEQRELLDRVARVAPTVLALAETAGVPAGGAPTDLAADFLNPILHKGHAAFAGQDFLRALRGAGLAPDNGVIDAEASYRQGYDAASILSVRKFLERLLEAGVVEDGAGAPRPLSLKESVYLIEALGGARAVLERVFPREAASLKPELFDHLQAFAEKPGRPSREAVLAAGAGISANRLWLTLYAAAGNHAENGALHRLALELIAKKYQDSRSVSPAVKRETYRRLVDGLGKSPEAGWSFLSALPAALRADAQLRVVVAAQVAASAGALIEAAAVASGEFERSAVAAGLRRESYPYDLVRFKRVELLRLRDLLSGAPARRADALVAVAAAYAFPEGGTAQDRLDEGVAVALKTLNGALPLDSLHKKLREAGLAPVTEFSDGYQNTLHIERDFMQGVDLRTLRATAAFVERILSDGVWYAVESGGMESWMDYSKTTPLAAPVIRSLQAALEGLETLRIIHFPGEAALTSKTELAGVLVAETAGQWLRRFDASSDQAGFVESAAAIAAASGGDISLREKTVAFLMAASARGKRSGLIGYQAWTLLRESADAVAAARNTDRWSVLSGLLRGQGPDSPFAAYLRTEMKDAYAALLAEAADADPAALDALVAAGVLDALGEARGDLTLARISAVKGLLPGSRARIDALLASAERLGLDAGTAQPPAEFSEGVRFLLKKGYSVFSGTSFHDALKEAGLAKDGAPSDLDKGYYKDYPAARVAALHAHFDRLESSGKIKKGGELKEMSPKEKETLRQLRLGLERLERLKDAGKISRP